MNLGRNLIFQLNTDMGCDESVVVEHKIKHVIPKSCLKSLRKMIFLEIRYSIQLFHQLAIDS